MDYTIIKSVLMIGSLIVGFGIFGIRLRGLIKLMNSVEGKSSIVIDRIPPRILSFISDILGQSNVRRKIIPGLAHTLIFYGFLAVQLHSLEMMIQGVFPGFGIEHINAAFYGGYLYLADILAFFVLIGLGFGLFRRTILKPKYLTNGMDAKLILIFTAVIIITFHFVNAFSIGLSQAGDGFKFGEYFTISLFLYEILNLKAVSTFNLASGYEVFYWIHILTILGFAIYIPGSKHLHLLAAIPNVFLKPLAIEKSIFKTDIEDETAESFGLGKVHELNRKNVLDLYACTECGRCEERCPADRTGKPLSPKKFISDIKHDLFEQKDLLFNKEYESIQPLVRADGSITQDTIWSCTTCRACEDICPVNIQHLDIMLESRKFQVLMEASFPPEMQETFSNLENQSNPWGFGADTRADWSKGLDVPLMTDNPEADILYYVGCAGSFDDRGKKIARAIARLLNKANINFAILGPEERCNGDIARRSGNEYLAQMMMQENVEVLNQYKPKKILTGCPHCFNSLKNEFPQFDASYDVVHHSDFILELIQNQRLKTNQNDFGKLTYHDSCYLGRWNNIYDSPRNILKSINKKGLVEIGSAKDNAMCCGAGGGRMFMEETLGKRINNTRAREIIKTQADTVAAACPFCITMLDDGIKAEDGKMIVKDIAEIVDEVTHNPPNVKK